MITGNQNLERRKRTLLFSIALTVFAIEISVCVCMAQMSRPQEPAEPFPYSSEEVEFENPRAGITLAGTLTIPESSEPHPAVVLVTGSGPQDRDETLFGHRPFLVLADHLTRHGIAVLRYDDRGVGQSSGDFASATLTDFVSDARAAVEFLQTRKEIDHSRIGLAGHSEGGAVIPLTALELPGRVAFLVLLAAPAHSGEEVFYLQDAAQARARGMSESEIERNQKRKEQIFSVLKNEPDVDTATEKLREVMLAMKFTSEEEEQLAASGANINDLIDQQIILLNNAYTRMFLTYDPLPTLRRVNIPLLALTGEKDLQVPPKENLPLIEAALAEGESPAFLVRELPKLNHLFQTSETGFMAEYAQIEETFAPIALEQISNWILETSDKGE